MRLLDPGARQLAYTLEGPKGALVVMFSNSLGTGLSSWQAQAEALSRHLRVLRYDTRPAPGRDTSAFVPASSLGELKRPT